MSSIYRVYNAGELYGFGHGWRQVIALPAGRKWITLVDWTTLETSRIALPVWARLKPQAIPYYSARSIRKAMKARLKYVTKTKTIREAMEQL